MKKKNSFLFRSEILGPLVNMLTAQYKCSCSNRENLPLPIQMESSKKLKTICQSFIAFLESTLNFEHFEKNKPHSLSICEIRYLQKHG